MKKLLFVINPKAGKTAIKNDFFDILLTFSTAGYDVVPYFTTGPDDAERKVSEDGADYDMIVCAGGDGTLENTVCGYMKMGEKKVPIGYIPVGTTNDFARSHKISRRPLEAAKQIVNGKVSKIDVGRFDDKYFIYIAAFGIFTDISYTTKQSLKKAIGHSAYVIEAVKNIANYKSYKIRGEFDGALLTGNYIFGMITNSMSVGGFKIRGSKHVSLDDGKFDCLFIRTPKNTAELQSIISAMLTNTIDGNEMFFEFKASRIKIECEEAVSWTLDGEFGGDKTEVIIYNEQKAIDICMDSKYEYSVGDELAASFDDDIDEIDETDDIDNTDDIIEESEYMDEYFDDTNTDNTDTDNTNTVDRTENEDFDNTDTVDRSEDENFDNIDSVDRSEAEDKSI